MGLVPVVLFVLVSCSTSADPVAGPASAEEELEAVTSGVAALMIENKLAAIPNPASGSTAPCETGTQVMTAYPDTASAAGSADKLRSPSGNLYRGPNGDKNGYVLRGHDLSGDNSSSELVYYLNYDRTRFCYTISSDGTVGQFSEDGAALTAIAGAPEANVPIAPTPMLTGEISGPLTEETVRVLLTPEEVASALPMPVTEPGFVARDVGDELNVILGFESAVGTVTLNITDYPTPELARDAIIDFAGPQLGPELVTDLVGELAFSVSVGGVASVNFIRDDKLVWVQAVGLPDAGASLEGLVALADLVDSRLSGSTPMGILQPTATPLPTPTPEPTPTPLPTPTPTSTPASEEERLQQEWDALIEAAQDEGQLVLVMGGSAGRAYRPVVEFFSQNFGIEVVISAGASSSLVDRMLGPERFQVDVSFMGGSSPDRLLLANALDPIADLLIHPEVTDTSLWFGGTHLYADEAQQYVFILSASAGPVLSLRYNTNLMTQGDLDSINSVWDYVDPKWAGKIVALSPLTAGVVGPYYEAYVHPDIGREWVDAFVAPELGVTFLQNSAQLVDGVAKGRYHFTIATGSVGSDLDSLAQLGASVERFPCTVTDVCARELTEAGSLTGAAAQNTVMVLNDRPHPNAAKLFVNWFLGREGQTIMHTRSVGNPQQTLRTDVSDFGRTLPHERRNPDREYYLFSSDPVYTVQREEALQYAKDAFNANR